MSIIKIENLSRQFKTLNRHEGLLGSIRDLFSRDYKIVKAVDNISLEIFEGEFIGFVGPNGAGKSTTIKMMTGVLMPTNGSITVNGHMPYRNRQKNAQNIGVVFGQRTQLWWDLPVIESFKLLKHIYRIDKNTFNENMDIFNDLVNLKSLYSTPVRNLSLGQRMLCDIVASFLHNPKVIFLDEPTIGLDVSIKNKIRTVLKDLNQRKKTTIILTTHDIGDIEALCKRIVIIDKGSIIYDGDIQKINGLFGSYRTLKVEFDSDMEELENSFEDRIKSKFTSTTAILFERQQEGWIDLTVNQDEIRLLDVLNHVMTEYPIKDVKIEEIKTENIIRKIYEGALA